MRRADGVDHVGKLSRMEGGSDLDSGAFRLEQTAKKLAEEPGAVPVASAKAEVPAVAAGGSGKVALPKRAAGAASHLELNAHEAGVLSKTKPYKVSRKKRKEDMFKKLDRIPEDRAAGSDGLDEDLSGEFITSSDPYTAP